MRRASAISLLAAIGYALIVPLAFSDPEANLPACCRRTGAHHCAMSNVTKTIDGVSTPALQAVLQKCPAFPVSTAVRPGGAAAFPERSQAIFAGLVSHPSIQPQTEARYRVSFSRSRQKRGPPASLLNNS